MGSNIAKYFPMVDKDKDGSLDLAELTAMQAGMGRRRDQAQQAPMPSSPAPAKSGGGL